MNAGEDLRRLLLAAIPWFEALGDHAGDEGREMWPAWRVLKSPEPGWWVGTLSLAADFARSHGLLDAYRKKLAGLSLQVLSRSLAKKKGQQALSPIWEITNELVVGAYLERVVGWRYLAHEPPGNADHRGEWAFETPAGEAVFVEVKTLSDPERMDGGGMRGPNVPRLQAMMKGAYKQLPKEGFKTLVVVVGDEPCRAPLGIAYGDLFQALFGRMRVRMKVLPFVEESVEAGPAMREMFVQREKHRRLGVLAGMVIGGGEEPRIQFYAIHNPYATPAIALSPEALPGVRQFIVPESGSGFELEGMPLDVVWAKLHGPRGEET